MPFVLRHPSSVIICHIEGDGIPGSKYFETALQSGATTPVTCETVQAEDIGR